MGGRVDEGGGGGGRRFRRGIEHESVLGVFDGVCRWGWTKGQDGLPCHLGFNEKASIDGWMDV